MQRTYSRPIVGGTLALMAALIPALLLAARADQTPATKAAKDDNAATQTTTEAKPVELQVGMTAPDFTLPDQDGKPHHLADLRGKTVVLAFYPADMTPGCTAQMCALRDYLPKLQSAGAIVFGISVQDVASKRKFADAYKLNFPILADSDKKVTQAYGVLGPKGYAERVTFIIKPDGTIKNIDRALRFDIGPNGLISSHAEALELALKGYWQVQLGKPVPSFTLPNYDGKPVTSTSAKAKATVLIFISTQCPISNAYNARMEKLAQQYAEKGVVVLGINSSYGETLKQIATHAKHNNFTFPVLKDKDDVIADHFKAQYTPEVWVLDSRSIARYHGAIDDSQGESVIKAPYLTEAIDALLNGKEPPKTETKAFGCAILRKPE